MPLQQPSVCERVPFEAWFTTQWQREGETRTRALARLEGASGLALMTLRRAIRGLPLRLESASKLSATTNGAITTAQLVVGNVTEAAPAPTTSPGTDVPPSAPSSPTTEATRAA